MGAGPLTWVCRWAPGRRHGLVDGRRAVDTLMGLFLLGVSSSLPPAPSPAIEAAVTLTIASRVLLQVPSGHSVSVVPASDPISSWLRLNSEPLGIAPFVQLEVSAPFLKQDAICPQWPQKTRPPPLYSLCDCQQSFATHRG